MLKGFHAASCLKIITHTQVTINRKEKNFIRPNKVHPHGSRTIGSYPLHCWAYKDGNRTIDYPGVNSNGCFEVENIKHFEHTDYKQLIVNSNCSLAWITSCLKIITHTQVTINRKEKNFIRPNKVHPHGSRTIGSYPLRCWAYKDGSRTIDYPGVNSNGCFEVVTIKHFEHTDYKQLIVNSNCSLAWIMYITGDTLTDQVVVGRTLLTAFKFGVQALIQWRLTII